MLEIAIAYAAALATESGWDVMWAMLLVIGFMAADLTVTILYGAITGVWSLGKALVALR